MSSFEKIRKVSRSAEVGQVLGSAAFIAASLGFGLVMVDAFLDSRQDGQSTESVAAADVQDQENVDGLGVGLIVSGMVMGAAGVVIAFRSPEKPQSQSNS